MKKPIVILIATFIVLIGLLEVFSFVTLNKTQNVIKFTLISSFVIYLTFSRKK
jgi:hypothetical protein